jgi:hypothetical protein
VPHDQSFKQLRRVVRDARAEVARIEASAGSDDPALKQIGDFIRRQRQLEIATQGVQQVRAARAERQAAIEARAADIEERGRARRSTTLAQYLLADHSITTDARRAVTGGRMAIDAAGERPITGLAGLIGFIVLLAGSLYVLLLPRLRMLLLAPVVVSLPALVMVGSGGFEAYPAALAIWPGMLVSGGVLIYALLSAARDRRSSAAGAQP